MGNLHRKETSHSLYYCKSWLTRLSFCNKNDTQTKEKIWRSLLTPHTKTSAPNQYNQWIAAALSNIYTKVLALNNPHLTNTQYTSHFLHKHLSHLHLCASSSPVTMNIIVCLVNGISLPSESHCTCQWWCLSLTRILMPLSLIMTISSDLTLIVFATGDIFLSPGSQCLCHWWWCLALTSHCLCYWWHLSLTWISCLCQRWWCLTWIC